ncbi:MAG: L,D-transpeptidase family protein [Tepidimonas sp.]|uniref:L,D-transpeptidase family protein n=1 Tax=Tepidimonas sp. TaxID=2002775 RepID=UPI0040550AC2
MKRWHLFWAAALVLGTQCASAEGQAPRHTDSGPEPFLARIFEQIKQNRWEAALEETEAMLRAYPNFRLGHLIKGDLLLARTRPLKGFGEGGAGRARDQVADLREEAIARLRAYRDRPSDKVIPRYLLQMRPDQKHALVVDTQKARLYVYRNDNGTPRFVADYYISYGKLGTDKFREGDKRTPVGIYHVTSSIPRQKLTDFYGSGAFPINYPNEWDKKMGRDGGGIWLHGTPSDTFSRPPKATDGCVVLANTDLDALAKNVQVGITPVILSSSVEWVSFEDWQAERRALLGAIEAWRQDWESLDIDRYARHYARNFSGDGKDLAAWIAHKRRVNAGKQWIKVAIRSISMFRNPGKDEYVVVTFEQDYQSNNLSNRMLKRQYWIQEDGRWKIVYEGAA